MRGVLLNKLTRVKNICYNEGDRESIIIFFWEVFKNVRE